MRGPTVPAPTGHRTDRHRRRRGPGKDGPAERRLRPVRRVRPNNNPWISSAANALPRHSVGTLPSHLSAVSIHNRRRSEEHTSELQSLMRISYAVFCLKKKKKQQNQKKQYIRNKNTTTHREYTQQTINTVSN